MPSIALSDAMRITALLGLRSAGLTRQWRHVPAGLTGDADMAYLFDAVQQSQSSEQIWDHDRQAVVREDVVNLTVVNDPPPPFKVGDKCIWDGTTETYAIKSINDGDVTVLTLSRRAVIANRGQDGLTVERP